MKAAYFFLFTTLMVMIARASGGGEGHNEEIPRVVIYQAINVIIIFGAGFVLGKKKIIEFFNSKKENFLLSQEKAQSYLKQAQQEHHEVQTRLDKLKLTKSESILKAKTDASEMKDQLIQDAILRAQKIKEEAKMASKIEAEKALFQLKEQVIREAFELSKRDLSSKATSDDQKKLQEDFISKVQVVQ